MTRPNSPARAVPPDRRCCTPRCRWSRCPRSPRPAASARPSCGLHSRSWPDSGKCGMYATPSRWLRRDSSGPARHRHLPPTSPGRPASRTGSLPMPAHRKRATKPVSAPKRPHGKFPQGTHSQEQLKQSLNKTVSFQYTLISDNGNSQPLPWLPALFCHIQTNPVRSIFFRQS